MSNSAQISQLVLRVDAQVAVAQRELQNLARAVRQNTGDINNALDSTNAHSAKMAAGFSQARIAQMELSHVVTASVDAYAAGASPVRILTLEMGRLAEAATFLGGSGGTGVLGRLAGFMGGPWGLAVLIGVNVLTQLIAKHHETGESVDELIEKMRKEAQQAATSKEATAAWLKTYEGAAANIDKVVDALDNENRTLEQNIALKQGQLKANIGTAEQERANLVKQLQAQQERLGALHQSQSDIVAGRIPKGGFSDLSLIEQNIADAQRKMGDLSRQIEAADAKIAKSRRGIVEAALPAIEKQAKALADPVAEIEQRYDHLRSLAKQAAVDHGSALKDIEKAFVAMGRKLPTTLKETLAALDKLEAKEKKAAEAAKRGSGEFGKQIGFAEAESIAKAAGLSITSGYRSTAKQAELYRTVRTPENPVARPGTSAHEGVNGKWALDIAFAPGLTAEKLKKLYGAQGVTLSAVYKETGHFHIEGSRSRAASAESAEARARAAAIREEGLFSRQGDQLDTELLQLKQQLTGDYRQQAQLAEQQVAAETAKMLATIKQEEDLGQISTAEAEILRTKIQAIDAAKKELIERRKIEEAARQQQSTADQHYQNLLEDLRFDEDFATTQADRRKIQLEIIDIMYEQKQLDLEYAKAQALRNGQIEEANRIQAQIARLPQEKARDQSRATRGTLSPLEEWARSVPKTAAEINEALQSIEARGLDSLSNALTDVIMGTKSLGSAFKAVGREIIAELIQMTIRMLIFRSLSSIFGSSGGGFGGSSGGVGGFLSSVGSVIGIGARAGGGPVTAGMPYIVGERRPELFVPNANGFIVPQVPRISTRRAANDAAPASVTVKIQTDENFHHEVAETAGQVVVTAAPRIVDRARQETIRTIQRPRLRG